MSDAVLLAIISGIVSLTDLAAKRASGQTVTLADLTTAQSETARIMAEAHAQVAADEAKVTP